MFKKLAVLLFLASAVHATTMDTASTQTVTGSNIYTSTRAVVLQPTGNVDVSIGATADTTSGALIYDLSRSTGPGIVLFDSAGQTVASGNSFLTLIATNTTYGGYFIRILRNDNNSNGEIRVDAPAPNYEEVETDQVSPAGKWEHGTNTDKFYVAARNAADNSFERVVEFTARRTTDGSGLIIKSTGTLRFEDGSGSSVGFKAPTSLTASWTHDLWTTFQNIDKTLVQTSNSAPRALAWQDTFCTSKTLALLKSTAPDKAGRCYYCSDCTVDTVCYSTGTATGAVAKATPRTSVCQ